MVLVEGWRWVPHSYAIVNSFHLLALADADASAGADAGADAAAAAGTQRRATVFYVRDMPFPFPPVNVSRDPTTRGDGTDGASDGLWPPAHAARLRAFPMLPPDVVPDVVLRHTVPWDLGPAYPWWATMGHVAHAGAGQPKRVAVVLVGTTETKLAPRLAKEGTVRTVRCGGVRWCGCMCNRAVCAV